MSGGATGAAPARYAPMAVVRACSLRARKQTFLQVPELAGIGVKRAPGGCYTAPLFCLPG